MVSRFTPLLLVAANLAFFTIGNCQASTSRISDKNSGVSVEVDSETGKYQVMTANGGWNFGGSLGHALNKMSKSKGHDAGGDYQEISFQWLAGQEPMKGRIQSYTGKGIVLFSQSCPNACEAPPAPFPDFTQLPSSHHIFSFGHHEFAPPGFNATEISTPWLLFNDKADAMVISPASHFMVASMFGDGETRVASGFNPRLGKLPAGFTQQTLAAVGNGINRTWDAWGGGLIALNKAKRPSNDSDAVLKYLGYWTDNGAVYYYNYDLEKGYAGTLQSLVEHYRQEQIPIRYLQLDSWWYYKTTTDADGKQGKDKKVARLPSGEWNRYGGLLEYKAHTALFPNGLHSFQESIGLPLITHNRWIDPASPYHQQYQISGIAAVDPKLWNNIAGYLKESGIVTYEQDWLDRIFTYSPAFSSDVNAGEAFLDNMARACREQGITMQYCMPYPCYFLQGSRYENLTTIRTSGDRFNQGKWNNFLYTSRLASALGIWPWADVYMSAETNNVLLSTLSAGPVGIGDAIGAENKANLLRAVRADGVIVKPDAAIVPLDSVYIADAQKNGAPLSAFTYTMHDGIKTAYLFAYNRPKSGANELHFKPEESGIKGTAYVHDYFSGTGKRLASDEEFSTPLGADKSAYFVVAPVGKSGIAFLGDRDKFVGTGRQRISSMKDKAGQLKVGVQFAEAEGPVVIHGYSVKQPAISVEGGQHGDMQFDSGTGYFSVQVSPAANAPFDKSSGDPVRKITVSLETRTK